MAKPPLPPAHAREVKTDLRRASKSARAARFEWISMRDLYKADISKDRHRRELAGLTVATTPDAEDIADATRSMWAAEEMLDAAAARWREVLAERAALPVADRWDLAALERWAAALDKDGAT